MANTHTARTHRKPNVNIQKRQSSHIDRKATNRPLSETVWQSRPFGQEAGCMWPVVSGLTGYKWTAVRLPTWPGTQQYHELDSKGKIKRECLFCGVAEEFCSMPNKCTAQRREKSFVQQGKCSTNGKNEIEVNGFHKKKTFGCVRVSEDALADGDAMLV